MLHYDELKQAIDGGYITGDKVNIVRKEGKVFDFVLPDEPVRPWEVVTSESVADILNELRQQEDF
ncbi:competence regulator inhibitor paratox [Streptococcus suis]|uniref:competence regulator inhibitor paratox n=1 Tax=Streptococcus suis TaxID=1307 RepID=UPI0038BB11BC